MKRQKKKEEIVDICAIVWDIGWEINIEFEAQSRVVRDNK